MASQHDPSESAVAVHPAASDAHRHGEDETTLAAARKAARRLRVQAFGPLFVALMGSTSLWNRLTDPHFSGFRPVDALRLLGVIGGFGISLTALWQLFVKRHV